MKLRKLSALFLAGALLAVHMTAASADEVVLDGTIDYEIGEQAEGEYGIMLISEAPVEEVPSYVTIGGKITECVKNDDGIIEAIVVDSGEGQDLQLNISYEDTVLIDANGMPLSFEDLKEEINIYAAHSAAQTLSLPPQSFALAIVVLGENEIAPKYMEVKELSDADGKTSFESADGNYLIAFDETTEFVPYKTRNIVTSADLKAGSKVFAWYGISTKSIPEQALATKIMILPEVVEETEDATAKVKEDAVIIGAEINGVIIDFEKYGSLLPTVEDGIVYLPVRAIAEAAGATVMWDGETGAIIIEKDGAKTELKIGSEKAIVNGAEIILAAAPKIVNDRTVIGVSVDLEKYGFKFITE